MLLHASTASAATMVLPVHCGDWFATLVLAIQVGSVALENLDSCCSSGFSASTSFRRSAQRAVQIASRSAAPRTRAGHGVGATTALLRSRRMVSQIGCRWIVRSKMLCIGVMAALAGAGCSAQLAAPSLDSTGGVVSASAAVGRPPAPPDMLTIVHTGRAPTSVPAPDPQPILPTRDDAFEREARERGGSEETGRGPMRSERPARTDPNYGKGEAPVRSRPDEQNGAPHRAHGGGERGQP